MIDAYLYEYDMIMKDCTALNNFLPIRKLYGNNIYKLNLVTELEHLIQHQHFVRSMGAYYHLQMKVFYSNCNDLPRVGMFQNSEGIWKLGLNKYSGWKCILYQYKLHFIFLSLISLTLSRMQKWELSLCLIEIETANTLKRENNSCVKSSSTKSSLELL